LYPETLFTGHKLERLKIVDSTNNYILENLKNNPLDGWVVCADYQTGGKGQTGAVWNSNNSENLLFSVLYYPNFITPDKQFYLSMAISLGICDFINHFCHLNAEIKWPNDILINKKKVAGVLIESAIQKNTIKAFIAGIGINVNQTNFINLPNATSLKLEKKEDFGILVALKSCLNFIEMRYLQINFGSYDLVKKEYEEKLYGLNVDLPFIVGENKTKGTILGVKNNGKLLVLINNEKREFMNKEIQFEGISH
jgi:BirA family biotin operon repressor/biotin-[acetyl-CoA-carboxylase] ligase